MKGKWIFRHHAPMGYRNTSRDMFFAITNVQHPDGYLFESEGKWITDISKVAASSHDRGLMSLRGFKKYLRKHPELEVHGNVMSLCSRYVGVKGTLTLKAEWQRVGSFNYHIDAIFIPLERQGFPEIGKEVFAFIRMNDGEYIKEFIKYYDDGLPLSFTYYDNDLNPIGEVLYWEYPSAKHYPHSQIAKLPSGSSWDNGISSKCVSFPND